eukprot:CAMPEP_0184366430 /NCGR_PEP_ID=MMETSP1089-20130417/153805_1 /TAXON_ID=38269 ORGANISM="Gloeochaete wittrockiana, Strain SAG46.84" /NCGR_SAMPLE_ID=MMETSP1089 /ASSEMBLY_ACC=CAM_ASM_000445 /LENGTH=168 /DNA_ID=CAMNT_0026708013 /DNA_START=158 /DNA_END=660 /DNA_ORIENTATION=+
MPPITQSALTAHDSWDTSPRRHKLSHRRRSAKPDFEDNTPENTSVSEASFRPTKYGPSSSSSVSSTPSPKKESHRSSLPLPLPSSLRVMSSVSAPVQSIVSLSTDTAIPTPDSATSAPPASSAEEPQQTPPQPGARSRGRPRKYAAPVDIPSRPKEKEEIRPKEVAVR